MARSRWALKLEAVVLRTLMATGLQLHHLASPSAPNPSKTIRIPVRPGSNGIETDKIDLVCYFPESHAQSSGRWPVVINFHGGGTTSSQ